MALSPPDTPSPPDTSGSQRWRRADQRHQALLEDTGQPGQGEGRGLVVVEGRAGGDRDLRGAEGLVALVGGDAGGLPEGQGLVDHLRHARQDRRPKGDDHRVGRVLFCCHARIDPSVPA